MDKPDDDGRVPVDDRRAETELTPGVIAAREEADAVAERIGADIDPTLDAVLENCRIALRALAAQHAHLADHPNLDPDGDTRWAARWWLAGAALAYANALVDLSDRGYVDPALPVSRTLYEALGVLDVVNGGRPSGRTRKRPRGASSSTSRTSASRWSRSTGSSPT